MVEEYNEMAARDLPTPLVYPEPNFVLVPQAIRSGMRRFPHCNVPFPP
jgi:hypothetical protein